MFRSVFVRRDGRELVIFLGSKRTETRRTLGLCASCEGNWCIHRVVFNTFDVSSNIQKLIQDVEFWDRSDCSVLITRNNKTGKEVLAEMIHMYSRHRNTNSVIRLIWRTFIPHNASYYKG